MKFDRVILLWKSNCTKFGVILRPFRYPNDIPKCTLKSGNSLFSSENLPTLNRYILILKTPNLVPLAMFETLYETLIVLRISKASSLSVNFAEFPKFTEKYD